MTRLCIGAILSGMAFAMWACKGDPTSSLRNGPSALSVTPSTLIADPTGAPIVVVVRDGQLNPVAADVTAKSADVTIAQVAPDTSRPFPDGATHAFLVTGRLDGGATTVTFTSGSLDTSTTVLLVPKLLPGTLSSTTPQGGSVLTIGSTTLLKLDGVSGVTFGGGVQGLVLTADVDAVDVIVPFSDPGVLNIAGVYPTYLGSGVGYAVQGVATVTQTGSVWAGDDAPGTAPVLTLPATAGKVVPMITPLFGGNNAASCVQPTAQGPCMFYQFTVAASTKLTFSVDWDGNPSDSTDINLFACASPYNAATCLTSPQAVDTSKTARPAAFTATFATGTHVIVLERKATKPTVPAAIAPRNFLWTITHK